MKKINYRLVYNRKKSLNRDIQLKANLLFANIIEIS